ncbi:MAG: hypothetical protein ACRERS_06365, partial [Methylococcales bacterium]
MKRLLVAGALVTLIACQRTSVSSDSNGPKPIVIEDPGLPRGVDQNDPETSHYRRIIDWLRASDSVVPKTSPVHPLTATYNREAIVPPMCYTRTEGKFNPCYVCHQDHILGRENTMNDADLQEKYSFSDLAMTNHWTNLFEDRMERVANISDAEIIDWVNQDNYSEL